MPSSTPSPQQAADLAEVPIAVHPYNLDSVFLSKTIVSLQEMFTNTVDGRFDLSPLPANTAVALPTKTEVEAVAAPSTAVPLAERNVSSALPFSGGSQPYVASTPRDASSAHSTSSVQQHQQVAQTADAQRVPPHGSPKANNATPVFTRSMSSSSEAHASPHLTVVPLDSYHLLLSFREVDLAETAASTQNRSDGEGSSGDADFAAATRRATSSVEKLSAKAPGPRPPRSGVSVVRRLEGDMRGSCCCSPSLHTASSSTTAAAAADGQSVYPTLSRLAHDLPFRGFDGWVRDYTAYGLSRNATALRGAWRDKLREGEENVDTEEEDNAGGHGDASILLPTGTVMEATTGTVPADDADGASPPAQPHADTLDSAQDGAASSRSSPVVQKPSASSPDGCGDDGSKSTVKIEPAIAAAADVADGDVPPQDAGNTAIAASAAADADAPTACVPDSGEDGKQSVTLEGKAVSPSLDRLNCSSTTASSSMTSSCSPPSDDNTVTRDMNHHNNDAAAAEKGRAGAVGGVEQPKTTAAGEAGTTDAHDTPLQPPSPHTEQLWSDERRREAQVSSQLAHRFVVSDNTQHAIWAIEVTVPAMQVRVVPPAEFYSLEGKSDDGDVEQDAGDDNNSHGDTTGEAAMRLPRKRSATAVTQARPATTTKNGSAGMPAQQRSPSPADPRSAVHHNNTDDDGDKTKESPLPAQASAVGISPSCSASVVTQPPHGASSSTSQSCHTRRGRSSKSASPSVALAQAALTPLIGGARGFVDGHFSVARFNAPGALCWRVDETDDDEEEENTCLAAEDPLRYVQHHRRCAVLFISDVGNCAIRYANFHNRLVRTIAGMNGVPGYRDGSCASSLLRAATALAWCSAGLLFTDGPNNVVRLITHVNRQTHPHTAKGRSSQDAIATEAAQSEAEDEPHQRDVGADEEMGKAAKRGDEAAAQPAQLPGRPSSADPASLAVASSDHAAAGKNDDPPSANSKDAPDSSPAADIAGENASMKADDQSTSVAANPALPLPRTPELSDTCASNVNVNVNHASDSKAERAATSSVVPRVWTLAGCCVTRTEITAGEEKSGATRAAAASYVDGRTPTHACFGYLSDMALWADETGDTQLYLVDQTHHAVRVVDVEGGVSTYVGPLDYSAPTASTRSEASHERSGLGGAAADALPPGLVYPSCLAMAALIKERSPALMDSTNAGMLTPQPYLCSSTPLLFVASAVTGVVSVLLPISQRSELVPWNVAAALQQSAQVSKGNEDAAKRNGEASAAFLQRIHNALSLGVATEGRRTIGEATAPSLKHVVAGWGVEDDEESGCAAHGDGVGAASAYTRSVLRHARLQQALLYLRLRFPWVLPPAVPQLSSRLVAGCTCHVSGKRRGSSTQRRSVTSFAPPQSAAQPTPLAGAGVGVSLLPRSSRSLTSGGGYRASSSPVASPPARPLQPHRLLFSTPPRHPVVGVPYTHSITDPRTAAAAREVADLLLHGPPCAAAAAAPRLVEVEDADGVEAAEEPRKAGRRPSNAQDDERVAAEMLEAQQKRGSSSSSSSSNPLPADDDGDAERDEEREAVDGGDGSVHHNDGREEDEREEGERPVAKPRSQWLPPPTKSVSRSPVGTPRGGAATASAAAATTDVTEAVDTTPLPPSPSSYAAKFERLPAEQRQLRVLQTLEEPTPRAGSGAAPRELSASPSPKKVRTSKEALPRKTGRQHAYPNAEDDRHGSAREKGDSTESSASSLHQRQQQPSRKCRTPSRSPNSSSGRASPPLTPRSMTAHQLMQRRRTSRSNTAPHVPSVGSTAGTGKGVSQEKEKAPTKGSVAGPQGTRSTEKEEGREGRADSPCRGRSPSHAVHEAGDAPPLRPSAERGTAPVLLATPSLFHDAYDAAVRRLFRVYAYFATRTVTHAVVAGTRRPSREVEHYSMSFSAFHRFVVLTGYVDYLADVAAAAAAAATNKEKHEEAPPEKWSTNLTQVQRRGAVAAAASRPNGKSASLVRGSTHPTASSPSPSSSAPSLQSSSSLPPPPLQLLPLAVTDSRAVVDVLYSCGVRTQGYHVVTRMDFQAFRRAVLLLRTWASTAHTHDELWKRRPSSSAAAAARNVNLKEDHNDGDDDNDRDAAAFAFLDRVPSLDALSAEEVVAAYAEVYAQAVRTVPALHALHPGARLATDGEGRTTEGEKEDEEEENPRQPNASSGSNAAHVVPQLPCSTRSSSLRSLEDAMGLGNGAADADRSSKASSSDSKVGSDHAEQHARSSLQVPSDDDRSAAAATPPVSPISLAKNGEDVSCILLDEDNRKEGPASGSAAPPSYVHSALTREERLALDDLLRLLQRNEGTLRQLFDAYSVPVVVHRSSRYEAPRSAAAAAAASNPCSLMLGDSCSQGSRDASQVVCGGGGEGGRGRRGARKALGSASASLNSTALPPPPQQRPQPRREETSRVGPTAAARSTASPAEAALCYVRLALPSTRQDMWWKVQQLYTMSALESKEVFERTSHTVRVVPYRLFVSLWRTLDVFPSLMTVTATQQAYWDAVTTTLLRGTCGSASAAAYDSALQTHVEQKNGSVFMSSPGPSSSSAPAGGAAAAKAKAARDKAIEELLFAHTGLTYPCFMEAVVRVAMTVFSHEVDRVAYPTSTAKTTGLMQWCNTQVRLGLVEQRTRKHLHRPAAAAIADEGRGGSRRRSDGEAGVGGGGACRSFAGAAASSLLATRGAGSSAVFPDHLQLFHVPSTQKKKAT
ncbi:hypothetical protein ABB37_08783 [Leptomonas pyrrhocoris]|uniref:Uncharacterized protein n=1 Tax=Leptomonas pyrrhocoris TaxID=157538 RepID=A0A0M9FSS3_LEPPY|nr:hypothetical protein ABB37_08783 [Leptomonas pyrrhocoris]KPA75116.1 hypothetical protein ABB37_08783 [Leptomonas pyrrhocoris]|eukprot:XP_015653555.1 hypothetical protein ABB37_08783 [Leptomonas pyrrhocoris]